MLAWFRGGGPQGSLPPPLLFLMQHCTSLGPGQNPATDCPPHVLVFWQNPVAVELMRHVPYEQHCTPLGPGHRPAVRVPSLAQPSAGTHVPGTPPGALQLRQVQHCTELSPGQRPGVVVPSEQAALGTQRPVRLPALGRLQVP